MSSTTLSTRDPQPDRPEIVVFPPAILFAMILIGLGLQWLLPLGLLGHLPSVLRWAVGVCMVVPGISLGVAASRSMHRRGTNVLPSRPSLLIVSESVFARTRNPIYVGYFAAALGLAVIAASDWIIVLSLPAGLLLHFGVVRPEERYLECKFGATYRAYVQRTPRYL